MECRAGCSRSWLFVLALATSQWANLASAQTQSPSCQLPDFTGQSIDSALSGISKRYFKILSQTRSSSKPPGTILLQKPGPVEGGICFANFLVSDGLWVAVPKFDGTEVEAKRTAEELRLNLTIVPRSSNDAPAGTIVDQRPQPPRDVPKGFNVVVYVAQPKAIPVPLVVGDPYDDAVTKLNPLVAVRRDAEHVEPAGVVVEQSPAPPSTLYPGNEVQLSVSDGSLVLVPDVRGTAIAQARARLEGELKLLVGTSESASDAAPGVVSEQTPRGTTVKRGSAIGLVVSTGLEMPNVVGMSRDQAQHALEKFKVSPVYGPSLIKRDEVVDQDPKPATRIAAGADVSLTLSDNSLAVIPSVTGLTLGNATQRLRDAGEFVIDVVGGPGLQDSIVQVQDRSGPNPRGSSVKLTVAAPPVPWGWYALAAAVVLLAAGLGIRLWRSRPNVKDSRRLDPHAQIDCSARIDFDPSMTTVGGGHEVAPRWGFHTRVEPGATGARSLPGESR